MKEAQSQLAAAIAQPDQQTAATSINGFGQQHLACHETTFARGECAELYKLSAIFVSQRQQKQ